ncbi:MAG: alpha/beta hydrolase [Clostridium sp.]|uniref:alpha/beta hydrolase n=1 Tax=Clostridium sp. TaxID=1506 RepID=UPI00290B9503|nr:alpha/beta hydrolase [Clostridium sp.]MDU7337835.1 alpha/beta hydrolase [Clostridium sp.]
MNYSVIKKYEFNNFTAVEKVLTLDENRWRYTISGNGERFLLAILSNISGHLLGLPLAEEFREEFTTIALSVPPMHSFADTATGLKAVLDTEQVTKCNVIGNSNGGVYLQNLIKEYPSIADKIVFSHSLTSMNPNDAYTTNASEVKIYRKMRKILKVLPVSALTYGLGRTFFSKLQFKSGKTDTDKLVALCKEDFKRITKQDFYIMADCMEDFLFNHIFTSEPYINRPKDILIVDSDTDHLANSMQRKQMLELCPNANEYHFQTGGHVTIINCREEYFSLLHKFWDR